MTDTDKWIDSTYKELESRIKDQEDSFIDMFIGEYLDDFYINDTELKNTSGNYDKVNQVNRKFDEAYDIFILPFLLWYGNKLIEAGQISLDYFKSIGIYNNRPHQFPRAVISRKVHYKRKNLGSWNTSRC